MFLLDSHINVYNFQYFEMTSQVNTKCQGTLSNRHFCLSRSEYQVWGMHTLSPPDAQIQLHPGRLLPSELGPSSINTFTTELAAPDLLLLLRQEWLLQSPTPCPAGLYASIVLIPCRVLPILPPNGCHIHVLPTVRQH